MEPTGTQPAPHAWKPLIVCPHGDLSARVRKAFADLGTAAGSFLQEYPRGGAMARAVAQSGSNICFLDVASDPEQALPLIAEAAPVVPVVALNPRNDADLILRCLRRGACEFLTDPSADQVRAVLERLGRLAAPVERRKPSVVYCVVPGKAGAGASTLAMHLAIALKRMGASSVLLVDTDVFAGAVAFLLKLKPDFHLGDAVRDRKRMDADLWSRLAAPCQGIDVLAAPENPAAGVEMSRAIAADLMEFWRTHYEAVVMDTAGAQSALEFARLSDEVLLVATNELVVLHATRRSIEYFQQNSIDRRRLRLIVNRYTPATGLKSGEVETALKLEPYALLANDYESLQAAVLEGKPCEAGSRIGRSIQALASKLSGKEAPGRKRAGLLGLLPVRA
jgi:pilus assembly protein CpaE